MRRVLTAALAAVLTMTGCGTERPAPGGVDGSTASEPTSRSSFSPAPSPTPSPATPPPPMPSHSGLAGPLAGFPLAGGFPARNGDNHSPVLVSGRPASSAFALCGHPVWDPARATTDIIGVEFRGEAEDFRGRTLVLYPSVAEATTAVDTARDSVSACPDEPSSAGTGTTHTVVQQPLGDQSVVWADTYYEVEDGARLTGTGLTVYALVRVGRAVLFTYEYGEGNGSARTRLAAINEAAKADQPVVDAMRDCERRCPPGPDG